ncbi:MAG: hypothetical protein QM644_04170 [Mobilitalea sp.]
MRNIEEIIKMHEDSFRANIFTRVPFRMVGLIDVDIRYYYGIERVVLAYYRSSGTNSGKINGLWYPIVGIKLYTGNFTEFTNYINYVLTESTKDGYADEGWLAKSLFFRRGSGERTVDTREEDQLRGFSWGVHKEKLLSIGKRLGNLYEQHSYLTISDMDSEYIDHSLTLNKVLFDNLHTQRENYERFIYDIYEETKH